MKKTRSRVLYYSAIGLCVVSAVVLGSRFLAEIAWGNWLQLCLFGALAAFLHARTVKLENQMNYSLGTAVVFPVIYLYGPGAGILISMLAGLVDSLAHKKNIDRTLFNMAQLSLSSIVCGSIYAGLGGAFGFELSINDVWAMLLGGLGYIGTNVSLVTVMTSIAQGGGFRTRIRHQLRTIDNDLVAGFWGIVFTLFVAHYSTWGIVLLGLVFVQFSRFIEMGIRMSIERRMRQELERELLIDTKTGVYNFRYLNEWLSNPVVEPTAVLFIDIDDFKVFNDRHGHAVGDQVLVSLAQLIRSVIRAGDKVIRYGGEEFVVLLPNMTRAGAVQVARRIQSSLRNVSFARPGETITVSIGIAACPEDTRDKHHLLGLADQAMYEAKRLGKDCFQAWSDTAACHSV